jgi:hypothetical protein
MIAFRKSGFIPRFLFIPLFVLIVSSALNARGQEPSIAEIESLCATVERDVVGTIHIPNFGKFIKALKNHNVFRLSDALDFFRLIERQDPRLAESFEDFYECLAQVNSLNVLIWKRHSRMEKPELAQSNSGSVGSYDFVLVFRTDSTKSAEELLNQLQFLNTVYPKNEQIEDDASDFPINFADSLTGKLHEKWVVVGNSENRVADVITKTKEQIDLGNKSLASDRSFKLALAEFEAKSKSDSVFLFARPDYFPFLFSEHFENKEKAELEKLNELPSSAMTIALDNESGEIVFKYFVSNTLPAVGIANEWDAMNSVPERFPAFCFPIHSTEILAWDTQEYFSAKASSYDQVHGDGKFAEMLTDRYGRDGHEIVRGFYEARSSLFFLRYISDLGMRRSIRIEQIEDYEKIKRYMEVFNKKKVPATVSLLSKGPSGSEVTLFARPESEIDETWELMLQKINSSERERAHYESEYKAAIDFTGKSLTELGPLLVDNRGWILTDKYRIGGQVADIKKLYDFMQGSGNLEDHLGLLRAKIDRLIVHHNFGRPEAVYTGRYYADNLYGFFRRVLESKYRGNQNVVSGVFDGTYLERLKTGENYDCDVHDLVAFQIVHLIASSCEEIVIVRRKEKEGGRLSAAIAVFFKQGDN